MHQDKDWSHVSRLPMRGLCWIETVKVAFTGVPQCEIGRRIGEGDYKSVVAACTEVQVTPSIAGEHHRALQKLSIQLWKHKWVKMLVQASPDPSTSEAQWGCGAHRHQRLKGGTDWGGRAWRVPRPQGRGLAPRNQPLVTGHGRAPPMLCPRPRGESHTLLSQHKKLDLARPPPTGRGHALLNQPWVAGPDRAPTHWAEAIPAQPAWRDWAWQGPAHGAEAKPCSTSPRWLGLAGPRPWGGGRTLLSQRRKRLGTAGPPPIGRRPYLAQPGLDGWTRQDLRPQQCISQPPARPPNRRVDMQIGR